MPSKIPQDVAASLAACAKKIAHPGKGILAADESTGTIGKRFEKICVENNEANRAAYRELLFSTKGYGQFISGCILYEETLFQKTSSSRSMVDLLQAEGVIPGIKVDLGLATLPGTDDEKATQGLDRLAERCSRYYEGGARFTKWRAVLSIDVNKGKPTQLSIDETAHTLARYAAISQANRLVPIVEPEILADGNHSIQVCADVTERVLAAVFKALNDHHVLLEGCLLKPNMVTAGADGPKSSPEEVAFYTVRTLRRTVPPALPGIHFLSGGQSEEDATLNLNAMNKLGVKHPWNLSFSYGRALQASCLKAWQGRKENVISGQGEFLKRAKANGAAQLGEYAGGSGGNAASENLFEAKYTY